MKKRKVLIMAISLISISALNSLNVEAAWVKDSNGWWNTEGSSWSVGWRNIDNELYFFGDDGYMKTGWIQYKDNWYYLDASGAMVKSKIIDNCYLGSDGAWNKDYFTDMPNITKELIFKTEHESYALGTKAIKVNIINDSDKEYGFGEEFRVEKFENNKWINLEFSDESFDEPWIIIGSQYHGYKTYDLIRIKDFEKLKSGKYRIVHCMNGVDRTAEFELK